MSDQKTSYQKNFIEENELAYKTLDRLYECRNLEISNLWQRSAFLIGILLLIFTGYGVLLFNKLEDFNLDSEYINISANVMGLLISILGFAFSLLWIKMGKGSKAWYEVYETAISRLERTLANNYESKDKNKNEDKYKPSWYYMGAMNTEVDNRLYHTNGGAYSPSKINIILGQYSLILWITSMIIHLVLCVMFFIKSTTVTLVVTVVVATVVVVAIIYYQKKKEEEDEEEEKKQSLVKAIEDIINSDENENEKIKIDNFKDFHDILIDILQSKIKETIKEDIDNEINFYFITHRYETRKELEFYVTNKLEINKKDCHDSCEVIYNKVISNYKVDYSEYFKHLFDESWSSFINDYAYKIYIAYHKPNSFMSAKSNFLGQS